jgi:hypothetical protein
LSEIELKSNRLPVSHFLKIKWHLCSFKIAQEGKTGPVWRTGTNGVGGHRERL